MSDIDKPSTPTLIGDAVKHATSLVSAELQLVRLEATEKLTLALMSLVSIVVAAVFAIVALIFLLQGLVYLIAHLGLPLFAASFIVGGGIAVLALVAILLAARNLSGAKLKPSRSIGQMAAAADLVRSAK